MVYGVVHQFPGATKEQDEASIAACASEPTAACRRVKIFHAAGPSADGWTIVAVHDSQESWERFRNEILMPRMSQGIEGGFTVAPEESTFSVENQQTGRERRAGGKRRACRPCPSGDIPGRSPRRDCRFVDTVVVERALSSYTQPSLTAGNGLASVRPPAAPTPSELEALAEIFDQYRAHYGEPPDSHDQRAGRTNTSFQSPPHVRRRRQREVRRVCDHDGSSGLIAACPLLAVQRPVRPADARRLSWSCPSASVERLQSSRACCAWSCRRRTTTTPLFVSTPTAATP